MFKNQDTSVAKAKKAIADYKKAVGQPDGLAELMVFYCERAAGFSNEIGLQDEGFCDALVRMFEQALKIIAALPNTARQALLDRLDDVRRISHNFRSQSVMSLQFADTSKKAGNRQKGVSCPSEESSVERSSARRSA